MNVMTQQPEITAHEIRTSLIARAEAFRKATKTSFSAMSIAAVNDSKFLSRVENPELGFNIKTYQRMVEWLNEAEQKHQTEQVSA